MEKGQFYLICISQKEKLVSLTATQQATMEALSAMASYFNAAMNKEIHWKLNNFHKMAKDILNISNAASENLKLMIDVYDFNGKQIIEIYSIVKNSFSVDNSDVKTILLTIQEVEYI